MTPCLDCRDPDRPIVRRQLCHKCSQRRQSAGLALPPSRSEVIRAMSTEERRSVLLERLLSKTLRDDDTGCIEWQAALDQQGYGFFWDGEGQSRAHRAAWELQRGPIPDGLTIDHLCRNRKCVNVEHLEPVTNVENILRSWVAVPKRREPVTECRKGHPMTGPNGGTYTYRKTGKTKRYCRTCDRIRPRPHDVGRKR